MKKQKAITAYKQESRIFYIAFTSCILVFCAYMYFVSASIVHVVMRKEVDAQIAQLGTHMGELESKYIEIQHSVSSDIATQKGFVVVDKKIFIDKTVDTLVVSRN